MSLLRSVLTFLSISTSVLYAQPEAWSLQKCINYATENNISVQQSRLQAEINKNNLNTARWDYAPNLSMSSNYGWNFGLNIDPVTNVISQQTRQTANLQLTTNWVLFDGGRKYNTISQRNMDYLASRYAYQDAVNDISLNVASAYLQILLNQEMAAVAAEQVKITQLQIKRMEDLVEAGANPRGDLMQLQAQLARDRQNLISSQNNVTISKLQLANLLQLDNPGEFEITEPELAVPEPVLVTRSPEGIYSTALENQPGIKGAEYRLQSSEKAVDISQAGYYPRFSIVGQVGTNYSDQIPHVTGTELVNFPIGIVEGTNQVVTAPQTRPVSEGVKPFGDQLSDNLNEFVGLNLTVPIFSKMAVRNSVQNAKLQQEIARLNLSQEKNNLQQSIYQAHADAKASYNSYLAAQVAVESSREAFNYAQERYNVGDMNQLDFETARNNLVGAQSEMLRAKFDYIFKTEVLEFYLTNQVVSP